jgi:hypothetical protein
MSNTKQTTNLIYYLKTRNHTFIKTLLNQNVNEIEKAVKIY